jgi:hypothetical protein
MNALIELNKSLHRVKETILQSCGELVLLDLGSGRLKLINDELHEETAVSDGATGGAKTVTKSDAETKTNENRKKHDLTPGQKEVCVDFLLRMKLRRKLSTRLVRRLTRLAHAMDGKDVSPPSVPKYGDLRLQIDAKAIESWSVEWKEKEDAKNRIKAAIDSNLLDSDNTKELSKEEEVRGNGTENKNSDGESIEAESSTKGEVNDVPDNTQSATPPIEKPVDGSKEENLQSKGKTNFYYLPALQDDFKLLKEHESAYEKTWDISTKSYNLSPENGEVGDPEYEQLTKGAGVGATSMFTSIDGLQTEYKRWQTHMLRKIQEQPTFDELGLKNRVFHIGKRRKRCLEEIATEEDPIRKKSKIEGEDDDENHVKNEKESGATVDENSESDEDEEMEGKDADIDEMKPKRSVSFAAVPSFHDQDLARIRMIHRDLLNSSQAELTRKRLTEATNEYNQSKFFISFKTTSCSRISISQIFSFHLFFIFLRPRLSNVNKAYRCPSDGPTQSYFCNCEGAARADQGS